MKYTLLIFIAAFSFSNSIAQYKTIPVFVSGTEGHKSYRIPAIISLPNGELLEHYGDILFELGEQAQALEQWRLAKQRGGAGPAIDRKINEGKRVE